MPWPRKIATAKPHERPKKKWPTPTEEGHYWAMWKIAAEGTRDGDELTPSDTWEVVQVNINDYQGQVGEPEYFSASVPGVEVIQWLDSFVWGPRVPDFKNEGEEAWS